MNKKEGNQCFPPIFNQKSQHENIVVLNLELFVLIFKTRIHV